MEGKSNSSFSSPTLCTKCCAFYANPQFGAYCSKCYQELGLDVNVQTIKQEPVVELPAQQTLESVQKPVMQADHSLCWGCGKKTGMGGYKCKCEHTYCKKHRLPESHACTYDFVVEGKKTLAQLNPNCASDKIERL